MQHHENIKTYILFLAIIKMYEKQEAWKLEALWSITSKFDHPKFFGNIFLYLRTIQGHHSTLKEFYCIFDRKNKCFKGTAYPKSG